MTDDDTDLEACADELSNVVPDARVLDDKIVIFTIADQLSSTALEVLADHGLTVRPTGAIVYTHTELTKFGNDDPMEATFVAE